MSLRFVEADLSTVRLELDYIEGLTRIPLPAHLKNWQSSPQADGRRMISGHYDNVELELALRVAGTDAATRDAAIRALITEITRENILEFIPGGSTTPVYYETYPYDEADPQGLLDRVYGENPDTPMVYPFVVRLQAKPFALGPWQDLTILQNLAPDWSFEDWLEIPIYAYPYDVCVSGSFAYVICNTGCELIKIDADTLTEVSSIGSLGSGDDQFYFPSGLCTDGTYVYVADTYNCRIVKRLCTDLSYDSKIGTPGNGNNQFYRPSDIATDGTHLYVADTGNHRIVKRLCSNLWYVDEVGTLGSGEDEFNSPCGITTDGTYLYIADTGNNRIVKRLCSDLSYVSEIGTLGSGVDQFDMPLNLSTDGTYLYVSDSQNHRIVKRLCSDLSYVSQAGSQGSGNDQFYLPGGSDLYGDYLVICDIKNNRVKRHLASDLSFVSAPQGWVATEVHGGGIATVAQSSAQYLFGNYSCLLGITHSTSRAYITSTYIPVDSDNPHVLLVNYYGSGTGTLSFIIQQYDEDFTYISDVLSATGISGTTSWRSQQYLITDFDDDCAYVRLRLELSGGNATYYLDGIVFADTKYLSRNLVTNPLGVCIPEGEILGDLPAPADIYLLKFDDTVASTEGIIVGQREEYSDDFLPSIQTDESDSTTYSAYAGFDEESTGLYVGRQRSIPLTTPLCQNPSFETHTNAGNSTTWTNWTASRGASGYLVPSYGSYKYHGSWGVTSQGLSTTAVSTNSLTSSLITVNTANNHEFKIMHLIEQRSGAARLIVRLYCYSDAGGTIPTSPAYITLFDTRANQPVWRPLVTQITPGQWPAGTIRAKVSLTFYGMGRKITPDTTVYDIVAVDWISFRQLDYRYVFASAAYLDRIKGTVAPLLHYYLDAAQTDKILELFGSLYSEEYGEVADARSLSQVAVNLPSAWKYDDSFQVVTIPSHGVPYGSDTSYLQQRLAVHIDSEVSSGTMYMDELALIPQDLGSARVPPEDNRYLVLDSNSTLPAVLRSFDGTKQRTMIEEGAVLKRRFTVSPGGTNLAILMRLALASGEVAQFTANVSIRYRPRYLVVG